MAFRDQKASFEQRLGRQLHIFSELSEMLTLRLLDLEERFQALEAAQKSKKSSELDSTRELLINSEERVMHLQALLNEGQQDSNSLHFFDVKGGQAEKHLSDENIDSCSEASQKLYSEDEMREEDGPMENEGTVETEYIDDPQMPLLSA